MKEIKGIVKMIVAIAEQTNLLSLNAAIEAAATSEEVSAGTQKQIRSAEGLTTSAKELNEMALELEKSISCFKI